MKKEGMLEISEELRVHFHNLSDDYPNEHLITFVGKQNAPIYCINLDEPSIDRLIDFLREMRA